MGRIEVAQTDEMTKVFNCPYCTSKFQAAVSSTPKAFKCPLCKETITVFPDGEIEKGDRTKPRQTIEPIWSSTEPFAPRPQAKGADANTKKVSDPKEIDLYREVLEQFKELSSKQKEIGGTDIQANEIKRLRKENERLMGDIFRLEERLRSLGIQIEAPDPSELAPARTEDIPTLRMENQRLRSIVENQRRLLDEGEVAKFELGRKIDELERRVVQDRRGADSKTSDGKMAGTNEEDLDAEPRRLSLWRKELDTYKASLEDIALSLVKEKELLERKASELTAREKAVLDLEERERKVEDTERNLLQREGGLRERLKSPTRAPTDKLGKVPDESVLSERERRVAEREAATVRVEDLLDRKATELENKESEIRRRNQVLAEREASLNELESSLNERQAALEKARNKLKELKERMRQELGPRKANDQSSSKQKELKDRLESKQAGLQEMETRIKDMLQ